MTEIEKRSTDLKRKEAYLAECDNLTAHLHATIEELEQSRSKIDDLERQVCGMRKALNLICDGKLRANIEAADEVKMDRITLSILVIDLKRILQAFDSAPKCRHEEEKERADMLHDLLRLSQEKLVVGEAGGRLLKAVQEKTEAQYNELLLAVCRKFPDESRHETALRYIREAEEQATEGSVGESASSLVGAAPIICSGCGGEINPDYGKCRRCG